MTMKVDADKWSCIKLNNKNQITQVVEKQVVSSEATSDIYNSKHGYDFVEAAERMIVKNLRVNGEFYVASICNERISHRKKLLQYW